jgi:phytoene dehydrogenase-like protein
VPLLSWLGLFRAEEATKLADVPAARWIGERAPEPALAELMAALIRVSTYAADLEHLSAGAALAQLASAAKHGVRYLDGGWQTLVDGVTAAAVAAGALVWPRAAVSAIDDDNAPRGSILHERANRSRSAGDANTVRGAANTAENVAHAHGGVSGVGGAANPMASNSVRQLRVRLADGRVLEASAVVIAAGPQVASSLLPGSAHLSRAAAAARPVRAACLDLALSSLPRPGAQFALGIDRPVYFSLHSAGAKLAPAGGAVLHVARYLDGSADDDGAEQELEALCDRLQPGWRARLVERRFMPRMIVAHDMPRADAGGLSGRAPVAVADAPGVYIAGDWVGAEGLLADAAVASARAAVRAILAARASRPGAREAA